MPWLTQERGFTVLEVILALGILGFIGVAFLSALGTSSRATTSLDKHVQAEELARAQIEEIKGLSYAASYPTPTPGGLPAGYAITISTQDITEQANGNQTPTPCTAEYLPTTSCNTLQQITVSVSREGQPVLAMTTYKKKP